MLVGWRLPVARYRTMAVANGRYVFLLGGIDAGGSTVDTVYGLGPASAKRVWRASAGPALPAPPPTLG